MQIFYVNTALKPQKKSFFLVFCQKNDKNFGNIKKKYYLCAEKIIILYSNEEDFDLVTDCRVDAGLCSA